MKKASDVSYPEFPIVTQSSPDQLKLINMGTPALRLVLILPVALCFYLAWSAAQWYLGSEIGAAAPQLEEGAQEAALSAVKLSPDDPLAHWGLAAVEQKGITPEMLKAAIGEYEQAVSLSPNDFRLWVDLGRAREQAGDFQGSEKALRRGVELAPFYAWPRWHLGNFLFRRGRYDEAFAELLRAGEADATKRGPVIQLAWSASGGDVETIRRIFGKSPAFLAEFISFLSSQNHVDEAAALWSALSPDEKRQQSTTGQELAARLVVDKKVRAAAEVLKGLGKEGGVPIEPGKVLNGDFESQVPQNNASLFGWHMTSVTGAHVALDAQNPHGGRLSLLITFNAPSALAFDNITQLVAVEPGAQYRLTFFVRMDNLKSAAPPVVRINSADGQVIAASEASLQGKSDWQQVVLDFRVPPGMDSITLHITRAACNLEGGVCPIFGSIWYDDFNLQLLPSGAGARTGD